MIIIYICFTFDSRACLIWGYSGNNNNVIQEGSMMGNIVALNILEHIPGLPFFKMANGCDILLLRDDFYYKHNFYHNRCRILTAFGPKWIEISVQIPQYNQPINQIKTSSKWKETYHKKVVKSYSTHPYFKSEMPLIDKILELHSIKLGDYNYYFMKQLVKWLHLPFEIKRVTGTQDADIADNGFKMNEVLAYYNTEKLVVRPQEFKYLKVNSNIKMLVQEPEYIAYPQKGYVEFQRNISIIDTLMNIGSKQTRRLIVAK